MKTITITVDVDGNAIDRSYTFNFSGDWGAEIESMLQTLAVSSEEKF
jgi:hypothetical protein